MKKLTLSRQGVIGSFLINGLVSNNQYLYDISLCKLPWLLAWRIAVTFLVFFLLIICVVGSVFCWADAVLWLFGIPFLTGGIFDAFLFGGLISHALAVAVSVMILWDWLKTVHIDYETPEPVRLASAWLLAKKERICPTVYLEDRS